MYRNVGKCIGVAEIFARAHSYNFSYNRIHVSRVTFIALKQKLHICQRTEVGGYFKIIYIRRVSFRISSFASFIAFLNAPSSPGPCGLTLPVTGGATELPTKMTLRRFITN